MTYWGINELIPVTSSEAVELQRLFFLAFTDEGGAVPPEAIIPFSLT